MNAAAIRVAARTAALCEHVFGDRLVDAETARWAARIDPAFLAEVGWDAQQLVLFPSAEHPLLGRPVCRAVGCQATATVGGQTCVACRRRLAEHQLTFDEIERLPARPRCRQRQGPGECLVDGCARQWASAPAGLCRSHLDLRRSLGLDLARLLAHPLARPLARASRARWSRARANAAIVTACIARHTRSGGGQPKDAIPTWRRNVGSAPSPP